ncbi:hypothetical protein M8818_005262 [Zalaria obscura]|uniref:Uncharacterized protein n=1 Tax=Zalaria obscura TaxID=2024903 RepID=A0ACC3S9B2_9PEZI
MSIAAIVALKMGYGTADHDYIPIGGEKERPRSSIWQRWRNTFVVAVVVTALFAWTLPGRGLLGGLHRDEHHHHDTAPSAETQCAQVDPLSPNKTSTKLQEMELFLSSETFRNGSIERLSGAVQIPTMSYDDLGKIGEDKRWDVFFKFEEYLQKTYPLVHKHLKKELVNTHGLVYTWQGSDEALKPTLLMAHQDTVPVPENTIEAWTHPPWSGFYDGKYIWGRGASDCKNQLTAILEAVELLLAADYSPKRTVVLSFGFDEESSGMEGAGHLAPFLLSRYGNDSIAAIVDEGMGMDDAWGTTYAAPAVAEKGYTDVTITVRMPGGHSSVPPAHTSIGVLSEFIALIEAHTYPTHLDDANPYLGQLQCGAEHSPEFPKKLRKLLSTRHQGAPSKKHGDMLAEEAAKESAFTRYLMQTSLAVDIISGGVKVNALPERVVAVVNHRVNIGEHPADVHAKLSALAAQIAKKYNLTVHAFDGVEAAQSIMLSHGPNDLEPAPVTPTVLRKEGRLTPWAVVAGTTRALYGEDMLVTPGLMTGNTDTRYYWGLSRHIFRFGPGWEEGADKLMGIHTVDERIGVQAHVNAVKWFAGFVRNMDEEDVV